MSDVRVLVVDDQEVYRAALVNLVGVMDGYVVVAEAETGERAVELVAGVAVDLVLLDLRLPDLDGFVTAELIRATPEPPEVVLISTDLDALRSEAVLRSGARSAVAKAELDPAWLAALRVELEPRWRR